MTVFFMEYQEKNNIYYQVVFYYFPWISALFIIFALSSQPATELPDIQNIYLDKIAHIIEFFVLGICTVRVFRLWVDMKGVAGNNRIIFIYLFSFIFVVLFGLIDEIHQIYIEGRQFDLIDLVMDAVGMILVLILYKVIIDSKTSMQLTRAIGNKEDLKP